MNRGTLRQFIGEGYGFMAGVTEYFIFNTEEMEDAELCASGFDMVRKTFIDLPDWFPEDTTLVVSI